ncbi:tautomerase family protein [Castellaniella sp.]|uniref:tautomerase family protein n=1 Tax=Castellaniella sp. TaxID=1955812 RepID=UPI0035680F39
MPFLKIHVAAQRSDEQKTHLVRECAQAVSTALDVPGRVVHVFLNAYGPESALIGQDPAAEMVLYELYLLEGRDTQEKEAAIAALNAVSERCLGVSAQATRSIIHDLARENYGTAGGISALKAGL